MQMSGRHTSGPRRGRPVAPAGYGIATGAEGALDFGWVEERLAAARTYWLCSTRADGRPHAMPVWGLWLDGAVAFSTDPSSVKGRNLADRPDVVVHLESGDDVVVVEGRAEPRAEPDWLRRFCAAYEEKYAFRPEPGAAAQGYYVLRPRRVLAWREQDFPTSATGWTFA